MQGRTHSSTARVAILAWLAASLAGAQAGPGQSPPELRYDVLSGFFQLPAGENFVEAAGVAVNSRGHVYVFHRGKHPLMEFDETGKFLRSIADDLFVTAHMVRVDADDNIWTTDVGSHVVLKLSPEGRVLLAFGRMRIPGDDTAHFNQPTDIAFDSEGNVYITDGYGNSRVLKFNKAGNLVTGWGMKGSQPGQFDLPHTIAVDGDRVYVGDRDNERVQIFDTNGRFLKEWRHVGHPFGLFATADHLIYECDAIAGKILKLDRDGKILGSFQLSATERRLDGHEICVARDGSIFIAEVTNWRAMKLVPRSR